MQNILFSKGGGTGDLLPGKIERLFYVNPYGNEVHPSANPKVINALRNADVLIYSIGSLFTRYGHRSESHIDDSIIPCLIPKGIAKAIIESTNMKFKILLLNNSHDRETTGFTSATDYIQAIITACQNSLTASSTETTTANTTALSLSTEIDPSSWTQYITHLVYLRGCAIQIDVSELKKKGIECVGIWSPSSGKGDSNNMVYESNVLERVLMGICSGRGGGLQRRATVQNWPIR